MPPHDRRELGLGTGISQQAGRVPCRPSHQMTHRQTVTHPRMLDGPLASLAETDWF